VRQAQLWARWISSRSDVAMQPRAPAFTKAKLTSHQRDMLTGLAAYLIRRFDIHLRFNQSVTAGSPEKALPTRRLKQELWTGHPNPGLSNSSRATGMSNAKRVLHPMSTANPWVPGPTPDRGHEDPKTCITVARSLLERTGLGWGRQAVTPCAGACAAMHAKVRGELVRVRRACLCQRCVHVCCRSGAGKVGGCWLPGTLSPCCSLTCPPLD
jgi:hypothetical protein